MTGPVLDQTVIARGAALVRAGKSIDRLVTRAAGDHGRLFERLARYKAYADAILGQVTITPVADYDDLVCECGRSDFRSKRALTSHRRWCDDAADQLDPRAQAIIARYLAGEPTATLRRDARITTATPYNWLRKAGVEPNRRRKVA